MVSPPTSAENVSFHLGNIVMVNQTQPAFFIFFRLFGHFTNSTFLNFKKSTNKKRPNQ